MSDILNWIENISKEFSLKFTPILAAHVKAVKNAKPDSYSYALFLGEDIDNCTVWPVTNTLSMLEEKKDCDYLKDIKYLPDEWSDWHSDAFEDFNTYVNQIYMQFREMHPRNERSLDSNLKCNTL